MRDVSGRQLVAEVMRYGIGMELVFLIAVHVFERGPPRKGVVLVSGWMGRQCEVSFLHPR